MKICDLLESRGTNIVVVDVQPEYNRWCKIVAPGICELLNKSTGKIAAFYNDSESGMSNDDLFDVQCYLTGWGLDEQKLKTIQFIEKEYGFFRAWADNKVSDHIIIKVIRAMRQQGVVESANV